MWSVISKFIFNLILKFFYMPIIGRVGVTLDIRYEELFRDPDDASPEKKSVYTFGIGSLVPGASYYFRLRALNGHGSRFNYSTFQHHFKLLHC